jgi:hypothetical protein
MTRFLSLSASAVLASLVAVGCSASPSGSEPATSESQDVSRKHHCSSNTECAQLEFCDTEGAATCGGPGVCTARGANLMCTKPTTQVCGCDGTAYGSACLAHKAGVSLAPDGGFLDTAVDGDALAEMPWQDASATYFYAFTGNGTFQNDSGTFTAYVEPPCLRTQPACRIAVQKRTGTFATFDSTLELDYDDGDVALFDAQIDCTNTWRLVGDDWGQALTLSVSTITP